MTRTWRSLLCILLWSAICCADKSPFFHDERYNEADYGRYVQQHFKTSDMVPPRVNFMQPFNKPECDDGSFIFVAPRGNVPNASFYIMDHEYVVRLVEHLMAHMLSLSQQGQPGMGT